MKLHQAKVKQSVIRQCSEPEKNEWADEIIGDIHQADIAASPDGAFDVFGTMTFVDHRSWTQALALVEKQLRLMILELHRLKGVSRRAEHAMVALFYDVQTLRKEKNHWQDRMHCHALIRLGGPRLPKPVLNDVCEAFRHVWLRPEVYSSQSQVQFAGCIKGSAVDFASYDPLKFLGDYLANRHRYFKTFYVCPRSSRGCRRGECHDATKEIFPHWNSKARPHQLGR